MTRRQLLTLLTFVSTTLSGGFAVWAIHLWVTSRPITVVPQVLGASTVAAATSPSPSTVVSSSPTDSPAASPAPTPSPAASPTLAPYPSLLPNAPKPVINARHYALYHVESGKLLLQKESDTEVPIASTTKLMTAHLTMLQNALDEVVTVPEEAATINGSVMGLKTGEKITVHSLLYGLLLVSGNDAAHTLADFVGGRLLKNANATHAEKVARFVQAMNDEAARLGLAHTHYKDPAGLDDDGHSSAFDLAKLAVLDSQNPTLYAVTTTAQTTISNVDGSVKHDLKNSNRLVADYSYAGVGLGKTGYTPAAGHCLVGSASRNGATLIAVVLSTYSEDADASALEARKLLDWGFASYTFQ